MSCPNCSATLPDNARFCPQCGMLLTPPHVSSQSPAAGKDWLGLGTGLLLSLGISLLLTFVLGFPVFILGAVLPILFWGRRRGQ